MDRCPASLHAPLIYMLHRTIAVHSSTNSPASEVRTADGLVVPLAYRERGTSGTHLDIMSGEVVIGNLPACILMIGHSEGLLLP
jgi:hypothetical protein